MNDELQSELELEIFRAGDYGEKGKWDEAALDAVADDYDPAKHEAPVTLDHAQSGPAFGWVAGVRRRGDKLVARLRGLRESLLNLLRSGAFKKRSVELYRNLPETGRPYLKAVSFLGAAAPAVKGLSDPVFSEESDKSDKSDESVLSDPSVLFQFSETEPPVPPPSDAFDEIEAALRNEGRWRPEWSDRGVREFFTTLAMLDEIRVAPEQFIHPAEWFGEFLKSLPPYLPMGESAPAAIRFSEPLPRSPRVSAASLDLHRRAEELLRSHPELDYSRALIECERG